MRSTKLTNHKLNLNTQETKWNNAMPIAIFATLAVCGLFFGFAFSQILKVRIANIDAQVEQVRKSNIPT